ncbi:glucose 1-dehydrogenase [Burkholderia pseudomultivorans]|uniref:SDR family NAD(P)-dependent oxidoreductase n=1 Tax=Burkholderia pseudomultivorans TaxID=1207504 RepID=UPI0028749D5A|nr:glucose 1-dehydrogenase [Burkholderia pseudomultivorans]MDS0859646.1 glucose 1-dehydrogenase [Burkholderia pseudomultivorans]
MNADKYQWLDLRDRVCVVTGAAGAIGFEIAKQLATAGAKVALLDSNESGATAMAQALTQLDLTAVGCRCDVTDAASVQSAAELVADRLGPCEILVNNAATIYPDSLMNVNLERWNQLMAVNVTGYLLCAQSFGRQMMQIGGGSMVHIGSLSGHEPQPYSGAYSVSKAGIAMLSRLLAVELGEYGIRSNLVCPAMVRTPMTESIYVDPAVLRRREEMVPAHRISAPIDIAEAVLFFASRRSGYISGQDVLVDGGLSQAWLSFIPRPGFEKK